MMVILICLFIWFTFVDIKNLFSVKTFVVEKEAEKVNMTVDECKNKLVGLAFLWAIALNVVNIWAAAVLDKPVITVMAAVMVLLVFKNAFKLIKAVKDGVIVKRFSLARIYSLVFDGYVLYLLIMMAGA